MNLMRILVFVVLGLTATPGHAVPVRFTLEADPFNAREFTQRDSAGMRRLVRGRDRAARNCGL